MKYAKVVIKIGTSVLAEENGAIDKKRIESIASQVLGLLKKGIKVIVVSSGAIGCGMEALKLKNPPSSLSELQATAAVGQTCLMALYSEAFGKRNFTVGQVLLTQEDFDHRLRYLNIKYTIEALLAKKIVPIVNENDTVSTEEIKCGDNDRISSLVADLSGADLLVVLTNVDGLYDKSGKVIGTVESITPGLKKLVTKKCLSITKGGMESKIEALEVAVNSGIDCFIANGKVDNIIPAILAGSGASTYFKAKPVKRKAKKRWIAYSSKAKGKIIVDDGAKKALCHSHRSLLSSGIIGKDGNFKAGDVVGIADSKKKEFARGLTNYASKEIGRIKGLKTGEIEAMLGYKDHDEVVHRDNLVIL